MTESSTLESRKIKVGGVGTTYYDVGVGQPVILIHGSGPGASAWANWRKMIGPLSRNYRVIALDLVGWGTTERPEDIWYSLSTWTDQVVGLMDGLEVEKVAIVGNSLGGRIALELAGRHPERVDRMVLMGSPGPGMTPTEGLKALRSYEPSYDAMHDLLINAFVCDPSIVTPDLVQDRYDASVASGAHEAYRSMFHDPQHAGNDLGIEPEAVRKIETRTLVVHGREDRVIPLQVGINMAQTLPNADMHVFGNCGHWTQLERSEDFNAIVEQFLGTVR